MRSKGGPGSGRKPSGGTIIVGNKPVRISGPSRPIGVSPAAAFPNGRNQDGTPKSPNDIRVPKKPK